VCLSEDSSPKFRVASDDFFRMKYDVKKAIVVKCEKCGLCYTNPIPNTERIQSRYIDARSSYNVPQFNNAEELYWIDQEICFHEMKHHISRRQDNILDFGCGRGGFTYLCQKEEYDATGIDMNSRNINQGLSLGVRNIFVKNLEDVDTGSFSVITSVHVFEHLENCHAIVCEFMRILKKKGLCLVMVPNARAVKTSLDYKRYWIAPYEHMNGFGPRPMDYLFSQFGFSRIALKAKYRDLSMILTKYCGNLFNVFPTKLFCIYKLC